MRIILTTIIGLLIPGLGMAAPARFSLDASQSTLTVSGSSLGLQLQQQAPGSLIVRFGGEIVADVTGSTIQFPGGSVIDAQTNGSWRPLPGGGTGGTGRAPADFGAQADAGFTTAYAAGRNLVGELTSVPIPLSGDSFSSSALVFSFLSNAPARIDYNSFLGSGSYNLVGSGTNQSVANSTLTLNGATQTLTLRLDAAFTASLVSTQDTSLKLTGQLVASRVLIIRPEFQRVTVTNNTLRLVVTGPDVSQYHLESSTNLVNWSPRNATVTTEPEGTVFTVVPQGLLEFFQLARHIVLAGPPQRDD